VIPLDQETHFVDEVVCFVGAQAVALLQQEALSRHRILHYQGTLERCCFCTSLVRTQTCRMDAPNSEGYSQNPFPSISER
jgi:hypothetical protein